MFTSWTKHEIGHFHIVVVQKKGDARAKLSFCQSKPVAFFPVLVAVAVVISELTQQDGRGKKTANLV